MNPPTEEECALAARIVESALTRLGPLPQELRHHIRESLLDDLLCSPDGRRRLREAMVDVVVEKSGDIDRSGTDQLDELARKRGRFG